MKAGFFITGTDTGVGKTHVALSLMQFLREEGLHVLGMKPVASGVSPGDVGNRDALRLQGMSQVDVPYDWVNPFLYKDPVPPHLAARWTGMEISVEVLDRALNRLFCLSDCVVVEGAGGWLVPLGAQFDMADLAKHFNLPVILVVGIRLGCINHARLSDLSIRQSAVPYAGWVANCLHQGYFPEKETISELTHYLGRDPLARLSRGESDAKSNNPWNRDEILRRLEP